MREKTVIDRFYESGTRREESITWEDLVEHKKHSLFTVLLGVHSSFGYCFATDSEMNIIMMEFDTSDGGKNTDVGPCVCLYSLKNTPKLVIEIAEYKKNAERERDKSFRRWWDRGRK